MINSRRMRWTEHIASTGGKEFIYDFGGKARRKETSRETRYRCEDNIQTDLIETD
jgi:hypothetical protein